MKYRQFPNTNVKPVSAVGFGLWTLATGWWGNYTEKESIEMMQYAFDKGINLFDAADTYGNGLSEELIAKAFEGKRDEIVIATKVGYDFYNHGDERRGQAAIPQDFSPTFIEKAIDNALERLKTDRIDVLQLHNIHHEQIENDALWNALEKSKQSGKILSYGFALGPAIGWKYEGIDGILKRNPHVVQHIYNLFEQFPGGDIMDAANEKKQTKFLIRVPHSSGMLEGKYTVDTVVPENDHRRHRPKSWLINGVKKVENVRFIETNERSLGQASLLWLLKDERVASILPNIYNKEHIDEFASATDCKDLSQDEMDELARLRKENFGIPLEEESGRFKGTMEKVSA
jgi:aryl-alcohol dehydrogenase-like predicted oxidoreductase